MSVVLSSVVAELRAAVRSKLGYSCSAGVAHNKILAKLVCVSLDFCHTKIS